MREHFTQVLVVTVAGIVAFAGAALVRLDVRKNEAELRARAEHVTVESADSLGGQFERITKIVQTVALHVSPNDAKYDDTMLATTVTSSNEPGLALFRVSKGRVMVSFPAGIEEAQFRGLPFEDWSTDVSTRKGAHTIEPIAEEPLRLASGGWAIVLRVPLPANGLAGLSSPGDSIVAALPVDNLVQSAGLARLPGMGFDYQLSYADFETGRKHEFLASTDATLVEPIERSIPFLRNTWTLTVAPRGGWFVWSPIFLHAGLVLIFVLLAAILTSDLARQPKQLRRELEKRDRRLQAANNRLMQETQQRADLETQFSHASFHDAMTGLPNRAYFMNRLERVLLRSRRQPNYQLAVIVLNFDRFKTINDSLGHAAGDELLIQSVNRFENCLRPSDLVVARLGGDELAFLLFDIHNAEVATAAAHRLQDAMVEPFLLDGQNVFVTASMGIAVSSMAIGSADELIRGADIALSKAKAEGRERFELFDPATRDQILSSQKLEIDLRSAIEKGELRLNFQPILSLKNGRIAGMEVLCRWHHPLEGIISPGRFIPLAEESGLIISLNRWVMRMACQQAKAWRETLPDDVSFYLSVNLSARDLREPDLCDFVAGLLQETGLPSQMLRAEVTEGSMIGDVKFATELVSRLRDIGVLLLLDDFGTGYSSLSYLQLFKFDYLKIDQSFVKRVTPSGQNLGIIRAIVHMAEDLGIQTIAEGIETAHVMEHLRSLGCHYGQGYYFSRPVEAGPAEQLLRSQHEHALPADVALTPASLFK